MIIGFTGTAKGMTAKQLAQVILLTEGAKALHHGDCIGADAEAHNLLLSKMAIYIHPPIIPDRRAYCTGATQVYPPRAYLDRNHDIVDACNILIAAPSGPETLRSGTWATVRYAKKIGKAVHIIMPDGSPG